MTAHRRWYREPMLWLVMSIPAAAVVAGIATLVLALGGGSADSVRDRVRRTAQVQVADQAADREALQRNLSGVLQRDPGTGAAAVQLEGDEVADAQLQLVLAHPTDAAADAVVTLVRQDGQRWLGRLPAQRIAHDWILELAPPDRSWRLRGRLRAGASDAVLRHGLAASP